MRKIIVGLSVALAISGCVSQEEIMAGHRARCSNFGFAEGTTAFAQCYQTEANNYEQRQAAALSAMAASMPKTSYTNCYGGYGSVSCNTTRY